MATTTCMVDIISLDSPITRTLVGLSLITKTLAADSEVTTTLEKDSYFGT